MVGSAVAAVSPQPRNKPSSLPAIDTRDRIHARAVSVVAGNRDRLPLRALRRIARSYLDMDAGRCFVPGLNGEHRVLTIVGAEPANTVFDVGANVGEWTASALASFPDAQIHAFELVPDTAERLARRFRADPRVVVNACGLDADAAEIEVTYYPSFSEGSGVNDAHPGFDAETRAARVVAGDEYCRERGIESIDFLKIDVEGGEQRVLAGFDGMLGTRAIKAIQFEYGLTNIVSRVFLADLYDRLGEHGYAIGKIFPKRVDFTPYDGRLHEDFRGPNFIAVAAGHESLVAQLAGA
jgi:FkbM family methyltransferase